MESWKEGYDRAGVLVLKSPSPDRSRGERKRCTGSWIDGLNE